MALILPGVGWNFGFVGASTLVLECHRPEEKAKVQSFNDFVVFGAMVIGSFASGNLLTLLWLERGLSRHASTLGSRRGDAGLVEHIVPSRANIREIEWNLACWRPFPGVLAKGLGVIWKLTARRLLPNAKTLGRNRKNLMQIVSAE